MLISKTIFTRIFKNNSYASKNNSYYFCYEPVLNSVLLHEIKDSDEFIVDKISSTLSVENSLPYDDFHQSGTLLTLELFIELVIDFLNEYDYSFSLFNNVTGKYNDELAGIKTVTIPLEYTLFDKLIYQGIFYIDDNEKANHLSLYFEGKYETDIDTLLTTIQTYIDNNLNDPLQEDITC